MKNNPSRQKSSNGNKFSIERLMLFLGLLGILIFLWLIVFFFVPLLQRSQPPVTIGQPLFAPTATPDFMLPPTWTPAPGETIVPTLAGTQVVVGVPTRIYTPRPTSMRGIPLPLFAPKASVVDLARILQGESTGDLEAAYYVGWVARNRLEHESYGDTYHEVSDGFFGYVAGVQPTEPFIEVASQVIRAREDPTGGSLYALSRADITKLGIPSGRADVAFNEWFFFRTWPLDGR